MKTLALILLFSVGLNLGTESITLSLRNSSPNSIPLVIPGVMNPNLSPFSKSGVNLKVGQKVYFKKGRKKHLLFVASEQQDGATIFVNKLIKKRKRELGLN